MSVRGLFVTPLRMEDTGDGEHFLLCESLVYIAKNGVRFTVPKGFVTDLNSVPWFFRRLIPKSNNANRAAVLHDNLYARGVNKMVADTLYAEAMEACGVSTFKRWILYNAVDKFGQGAWNDHAKKRKEGQA